MPTQQQIAFVEQYQPLAERVGKRLGVAPHILLGQWGLETGWGKSVVPGTNNLGNIKDFRKGSDGVAAKDNYNGSTDKYRRYKSADEFGDHFAGLIESAHKGAAGAGDDASKYFASLLKSGYAEKPTYVREGVTTSNSVARIAASLPKRAPPPPPAPPAPVVVTQPVAPKQAPGGVIQNSIDRLMRAGRGLFNLDD